MTGPAARRLQPGKMLFFCALAEGFYTVRSLLQYAKRLGGHCGRIRSSTGTQESCAPGCLSGQTRSADQPPSITASRMFPCPSRKPRRAVMLPSPPCESLCIGDSSGGETSTTANKGRNILGIPISFWEGENADQETRVRFPSPAHLVD